LTAKEHSGSFASSAAALREATPCSTAFSRVRNADLGRFTGDRLMSTLKRLGARVEVKVRVQRAEPVEEGVPA
jgi:hypothetical protein